MSPFVRKVKTASGATAVQIVEKRNGRRRILEHVGSAHDEAELAVLVSAAQQRVHGVQDDMLQFEQPGREPAGPVVEHTSSELLWRVPTDAYARLGFDQIDDEVFASLVATRIIADLEAGHAARAGRAGSAGAALEHSLQLSAAVRGT